MEKAAFLMHNEQPHGERHPNKAANPKDKNPVAYI